MLEDLIKESLPEIKKEIIEKISLSLYCDIKDNLKYDITAIVRESIRPIVQEITNELTTEKVVKNHRGEIVTLKDYILSRILTPQNRYGVDLKGLVDKLIEPHIRSLIENEISPEIYRIKQKIKQLLSEEIALRIAGI